MSLVKTFNLVSNDGVREQFVLDIVKRETNGSEALHPGDWPNPSADASEPLTVTLDKYRGGILIHVTGSLDYCRASTHNNKQNFCRNMDYSPSKGVHVSAWQQAAALPTTADSDSHLGPIYDFLVLWAQRQASTVDGDEFADEALSLLFDHSTLDADPDVLEGFPKLIEFRNQVALEQDVDWASLSLGEFNAIMGSVVDICSPEAILKALEAVEGQRAHSDASPFIKIGFGAIMNFNQETGGDCTPIMAYRDRCAALIPKFQHIAKYSQEPGSGRQPRAPR